MLCQMLNLWATLWSTLWRSVSWNFYWWKHRLEGIVIFESCDWNLSGTLESLQKSLNLRVSRLWNGYLEAIRTWTFHKEISVIRSGYYRVFNSQNLPLKFGFRIHIFARIDPFWDQESILYVQNHPWEFQSFNSGPQKVQSKLSNTL